jgi:2-polyprenyl-3-methyl-5-hydroxy-6-metoxy-1,4-benzoquinol methylase
MQPIVGTAEVADGRADSVREGDCPGCLGGRFSPLPEREFLSLCGDCGLVFDNPRPTAEVIAAYYNKETQYDTWVQNLEARDRLWRRRLRKMRRHKKPGSLLDVGTGIGQFLHLAREEYGPVVGTEISSSAIEIAKRLYNLEVLKGTIESLPIAERFDNLTAFHVLEHVHRPGAFLERCHQLLTPGGLLFLAVPNDLGSLAARTGKHTLAPVMLSDAEIHLSHFRKKSLSKILSRCGFDVIHVSIDPFWVDSASREGLQKARYIGMGMLQQLTQINLYPTTWAVAKKS